MAYSDFNLHQALEKFELTLEMNRNLFPVVLGAKEVPVSDYLKTTLARNLDLALAISTEKARSEMIIAPLLIELRELCNRQISLFSGVDFTVEAVSGLSGFCDFILTASQNALIIETPVFMLVEAKNEDLKKGYGQCIAEMVAAQKFNTKPEKPVAEIYGAVTIGSVWRFLCLSNKTISIDNKEYYIESPGRILDILLQITNKFIK
jgi:hypothetical protein